MDAPRSLSIVIPAMSIDARARRRWRTLAAAPGVAEVIAVLPGPDLPVRRPVAHDEAASITAASADPSGPDRGGSLRILHAPLGRASQMNAGARAARGRHLLFLHADTQVPIESLGGIVTRLDAHPGATLTYRLGFASPRRVYRWFVAMADLRDTVRPFPLGDQGLALARDRFHALGGFEDLPLFEDVRFTRRVVREGGVRMLPWRALTSPRRFEAGGAVRTLLRNGWLVVRHQLGACPRELVRRYYGATYLERWEAADPARLEPSPRPDPRPIHAGAVRRAPGAPDGSPRPRRATVSSAVALLAQWRVWIVLLVLLGISAAGALGVDHSHARFDSVLDAFVRDGLVDYAALQATVADGQDDFTAYLAELAEGDESTWSDDEKLAYWINAYNAFTLKLIIDHYPIGTRWFVDLLPFLRIWLPANSILQIPGRWTDVTFDSVRGAITLDAIEHQILRPEFADPRIHAAIVCASIGCPVLRDEAYAGDRVDAQLDDQFAGFLSSGRGAELDADDARIEISKVFDWFREDWDVAPPADRPRLPAPERFGDDAGPLRWIHAYAPPPMRERLDSGDWDVGHLDWDWHLNEVP